MPFARAALIAAQQGSPVPALPPHGAVLQKAGSHAGLTIAGFRRCATGWLRIDMAEKLARQAGMVTMYEDGIAKALRGETTIEEVLRVTEDA